MKPKWLTAGIVVLLAAAAWAFLSPLFTVADRSLDSRNVAEFKMVGLALREYAETHQGEFPAAISDLSLESLPAAFRQFQDPATKQPIDWLYYPGHTVHDPPATLLAASPHPVYYQKRLVMGVDAIVRLTDEDAFQKQPSAGSPAK